MPRSISDAVVVVTGASSGIGRATAHAFARRRATVVLAARRADALREAAGECERLGGRALAVPTDVTDMDAVSQLAFHAVEAFARLDVWVNNAAVSLFGRIEECPPAAYRRVIETNLFGTVYGARAAIPYFRQQGSGVLVNVSSVAGKVGQPYTSAYCASKFAIVGLSECLRQELLDAPGVHVCTVLPASTDTPIFQSAANYTRRAVKPIPPVHDPEEVAEAIVGCVERPEREVYVTSPARRLVLERGLAPGWVERAVASAVEREHFQDRPAAPSDGNLFAPPPGPGSVRGGWRQPRGAGWVVPLAGGGAIALGVALAAGWVGGPRDGRGGPGAVRRV